MLAKILKNPITILLSVVLGIAFGFFSKTLAISFGTIGEVYLKLFQMTVIPILVTSIVASLAQLMKDETARKNIVKILIVFVVMMLAVAICAMLSGMIGKPGSNLGEHTQAVIDKIIKSSGDSGADVIAFHSAEGAVKERKSSLVEFFVNVIPSNIFTAFSQGSILQLVFFSIIFGIAIGFITDDYSRKLVQATVALKESFQKMIKWTMLVLPIGLFFLMGKQIAQVGVEVLLAMVKYICIFYVMGIAVMLICTVVIWIRSGEKNIFAVMRKLLDPVIICFATRNSFAALPSSVESLVKLNFNPSMVDLVFPLGVTVLRFGNIMYFALGSCFVAQIYGVTLTASALLLVVVGSMLAGTATAGASGLLTLPLISLILDPLGLPVESILVIFMAIDSLVDPLRTLLIVYVNLTTTALIAEPSGKQNGKEKSQD